MSELGTVEVRREQDIVRAHQSIRTLAATLRFSTFEQTRIATAMSEIARNALVYAGACSLTVGLDAGDQAFWIHVVDRGPGILNLEDVLRGKGRAPNSLGLGISGARRLMDGFSIDSDASGTRVVMSKRLPRRAPELDERELARLRHQLVEQSAADPEQDLRALEHELAERERKIAELSLELQETNRGVLALYGELEERAEYQRQAAELKTRLLSEMGHELRTPLHSILSVSQFLLDRLDGELSAEQEKQVHLIHSVASGLTEYVNDLLDLSKAEAGQIPVHATLASVDILLGTVRRMMQPLVTNRNVDLLFVNSAEIHEFVTDESKVSQILRNLVANALKFTERGHVQVTVRAAESADELVFEVEDTGIGIAPEHFELIFEEFAQVEGPHQQRVRGTGLGLPLSRRLAQLLGGRLTVTSQVGVGSVFRLVLPRWQERAGVAPVPVPSAPCGTVLALARKLRILVIDDDEASRYIVKRWLEDRFSIEEASGGQSGLDAAHARPPDAVLLDVVMPDLTGFEVLERLKEDPNTTAVPVIIYTSVALGANDRARLDRARAIVRKSSASRASDRAALESALVSAGLALHREGNLHA